MSEDELKKILSEHKIWLEDTSKGDRANLRGAELSGADLRRANLSFVNLRDANLRGANLSFANLTYAKLRCADLRGAYLRGANLRDADLSGANLSEANLGGANLSDAEGGISVFSGGRHRGVAYCTHISIGCKWLTHAEWRKSYAEIGDANGYSIEEIERYRAWIFGLDWLIKGETND